MYYYSHLTLFLVSVVNLANKFLKITRIPRSGGRELNPSVWQSRGASRLQPITRQLSQTQLRHTRPTGPGIRSSAHNQARPFVSASSYLLQRFDDWPRYDMVTGSTVHKIRIAARLRPRINNEPEDDCIRIIRNDDSTSASISVTNQRNQVLTFP